MIVERHYAVTVETLEPFRIGGPEDPLAGQDNPIAIVGNRAAIPGSSLKGALRAQIERYLIERFHDAQGKRWPTEQAALQPCLAVARPSDDERVLVREGKYRDTACVYPPRQARQQTPASICPVCYLLGAQGLTGFLRIPFLFTDATPDELYATRIDRATGTVAQQMNRSYRLLPPNIEFHGELAVLLRDDLLGWELGKPRQLGIQQGGDSWVRDGRWGAEQIVRELVIDRLTAIARLGGYRSKGFGAVRITCSPVSGE